MNEKYLNVAGSFECTVSKPESGWFGESEQKKTPFIRIPLVVSSGPQKGKQAIYKGWLSESTDPKKQSAFDNTVARLKEVFNFDGDLYALHTGATTLVGKPCNITTEMESYNAPTGVKQSCKIAWLNVPGGGGPKPMDAVKVDSLLSKLSAKAKAIAAITKCEVSSTPAVPAAPSLPSEPGEEDDGDVPF